jgi:hypothetical protein
MNKQFTEVTWNTNDQDGAKIRKIANDTPQVIIIFKTNDGEICNPHPAIQHFCGRTFTHPISKGFEEFMVFTN